LRSCTVAGKPRLPRATAHVEMFTAGTQARLKGRVLMQSNRTHEAKFNADRLCVPRRVYYSGFTPYSGTQQNWPVSSGTFVDNKYAVPVFYSAPNRPYVNI